MLTSCLSSLRRAYPSQTMQSNRRMATWRITNIRLMRAYSKHNNKYKCTSDKAKTSNKLKTKYDIKTTQSASQSTCQLTWKTATLYRSRIFIRVRRSSRAAKRSSITQRELRRNSSKWSKVSEAAATRLCQWARGAHRACRPKRSSK